MRATLLLAATLTLPVFAGGQSASPARRRPAAAVRRGVREAESITGRRHQQSILSAAAFVYVNMPLEIFVYNAYSFPSERVLGMPDWARRDKLRHHRHTRSAGPGLQSAAARDAAAAARGTVLAADAPGDTRDAGLRTRQSRAPMDLGPRLRSANLDCSPGRHGGPSAVRYAHQHGIDRREIR